MAKINSSTIDLLRGISGGIDYSKGPIDPIKLKDFDAIEANISWSMNEDMKKAIDDAIRNVMGVPQSVLTGNTSSTPIPLTQLKPATMIELKYPRTNLNYKPIYDLDSMSLMLGDINRAFPHLKADMIKLADDIFKDCVEVFAAQLSMARHHKDPTVKELPDLMVDGHVFDPWLRDMTALTLSRYNRLSNHNYETFVGPNYSTRLMVWVYGTTVDKVPVRLLLYQHLKAGYFNNVRTDKFYSGIAPFSTKLDTCYDLL